MTNRVKKLLIVIACIGLFFLLQSCYYRKIKIGDGGFITKTPCGPPCFWGITPGKSTEADAIGMIKARHLIDYCNCYNNECERGSRDISCVFNFGISFQEGNNIVEAIGFSPDNLTLGKVISTYGVPNGVNVMDVGTSPEHPPILDMYIFYDKINTVIDLASSEGRSYHAQPSVLVTNIGYSDDPSYSKFAREYATQDWSGFGDYLENK